MLNRVSSCCSLLIMLAGWGLRPGLLPAQNEKSSTAKPIATINGKAITEEDLIRSAAADLEKLEMQRLQSDANFTRNRHQILENTLKRMVEDNLLQSEATRLGTTVKDVLAREIDPKVKEPTPEEISKFYEANKARIGVAKEQVSEKIRQYLKQQDYAKLREELIDRLRKTQQISTFLEPVRFDVEAAGSPSRGPTQAAVTIVEFSDFQCPYCKNFTSTLDRILTDYKNDVRLVFRQLPLAEIHPLAQKAAEASLCANEQGRFWELHDLMFKEQSQLKDTDLKAKAARLGLDGAAFGACLDSGRYLQKVKADIRDSARAGVAGTPGSFVNGRFVDGAKPYEEVVAIIQDELQKKRAGAAKP